jgi:prevent-host-death family protein
MKRRNSKPQQISVTNAREYFHQLLREISARDLRVVVGKHGEPQVVMMSLNDYLRSFIPEDDAIAGMRREAAERGLDKLSMSEIDAEIVEARRERRARRLTPLCLMLC